MNWQAYQAFQNQFPGATKAEFDTAFCGEWRSTYVFAKDHFEQHFTISEAGKEFINYGKYKAHLFSTEFMAISTYGGVVWVFKKVN